VNTKDTFNLLILIIIYDNYLNEIVNMAMG